MGITAVNKIQEKTQKGTLTTRDLLPWAMAALSNYYAGKDGVYVPVATGFNRYVLEGEALRLLGLQFEENSHLQRFSKIVGQVLQKLKREDWATRRQGEHTWDFTRAGFGAAQRYVTQIAPERGEIPEEDLMPIAPEAALVEETPVLDTEAEAPSPEDPEVDEVGQDRGVQWLMEEIPKDLGPDLLHSLTKSYDCFDKGAWRHGSNVCQRCVLAAYCQRRALSRAVTEVKDRIAMDESLQLLLDEKNGLYEKDESDPGTMATPENNLGLMRLRLHAPDTCNGCEQLIPTGELVVYLAGQGVFHPACCSKT